MDLMNRRGLMSNKNILVGQFALWKTINITQRTNFDDAKMFKDSMLSGLISNYDNIVIRCVIRNNTNNARAAIDYAYMKFTDGDVITTAENGHRVGGTFQNTYGADFYAGAQIYVYYAILDSEVSEEG